MARILFDEDKMSTVEEIKGQNEFSFWNMILGMLSDPVDYTERVNKAINLAYEER